MTQHLKRLDDDIDENIDDYYLGYQPKDQNTAWAKYFNDTPVNLSQEFMSGLESSPFPPGTGQNIQQAAEALAQPGYLQLENGFTVNDDGSMMLAIRTEQPPEFTGEMFDFWFSWHVNDTTKYKLWNPSQHQYAAIDDHFIANASTSQPYRERYWNITSFVDEWIGDTAYKLSIAFFDPRIMNFTLEDTATGTETLIMGYVDLFRYVEEDPTSMAQAGMGSTDVILAHQIRKKPDGSGMEMRSRITLADNPMPVPRQKLANAA
ncbi:hypothetical protein N0V93_003032 [Gnomoniopsis smithogilvyi]|uniref:DAPG hydrolase PhiG domain-containing protein n=1 Tax=Gnomoniopsis smithogilvyi TaxID=1191159 RepID=A0A9W8YZQ0_9PEZI|nr:hypothetical protein N0V93_003032 [Gnomoniopsis smithogilvyi]